MTTIAICNLKGGTGKTTTAIFLAYALTRAGDTVTVIDADPQGSATEWAARADDKETPFQFTVKPGNARSLARDTSDATWTLIDCPPGTAQIIDAAVAVADHVIIPTRPSGIEIDRMWEALDLSEKKNPKILMTSIICGTKSLNSLKDVLKAEEVETYDSAIRQREAIKNSFGYPLENDLYGYEAVAEELKSITGK